MFQTADIDVSASHEFIEAFTDPHPFTKTAYAHRERGRELPENGGTLNNGAATVTLDKSTAINGDMITVTVTPTNWGSLGVVYVWFKSLLPGKTSADPHGDYPIIISQN